MLGRTITIARQCHVEIVGVLAPDARLLDEADVYTPLAYDDTFSASTAKERRGEFLDRDRPGEAGTSTAADRRRSPAYWQRSCKPRFAETNDTLTFNAVPSRDMISATCGRRLLVLLGAVGFVLLVACANVANLLLARASARQAELAVRSALGAGRVRLLRQLLTEAVVLGVAGAASACVIAGVATRALVAAQPADIPRLEEVGVNGAVVAFTFAIALATSLAFGMLPALQFSGKRAAAARCATARAAARAAGLSHAIGARRRRDGARGRAADRRRPADSELHPVDAGRSRLPRRTSPVISRDAAE